MNKLLVALLASAFALTAFAQAPKSDTAPKAPTTAETQKSDKKAVKGEKKAKAKAKAKAEDKKAAAK